MKDIFNFFEKPKDPLSFSAIRISLASPEKIREWSHGEVKKPETINYRTFKPERDGLFCAKIFGPVKDYECNCGKYKRMKHRGVVCEKCGVEVIQSKVRRERLGHIDLATPVAHIWFLKSLPSRIGNLLDITLKDLEKVLYCEAYVVVDPKETGLQRGELLTEERYIKADRGVRRRGLRRRHGRRGDPRAAASTSTSTRSSEQLRAEMKEATSEAKRKKLAKRLKVVEAFRESGNKPEWMMLEVIPVIPPDLRPLVPLDGGRFATSRPERPLPPRHQPQQPAEAAAGAERSRDHHPQREADAAGGGRRPVRQRPSRQDHHRPEQAPAEVAVRHAQGQAGPVPPEPARQARRLLGPFGHRRRPRAEAAPVRPAEEDGARALQAVHLQQARRARPASPPSRARRRWSRRSVPRSGTSSKRSSRSTRSCSNRAPTLHRLGIQAFEPLLIEGKAIQLHPLVCAAFNADFDGDQMAVHVPLSLEAQMEARVLMMSTNNILRPANGRPIILPSQDIVLGLYYMTRERMFAKGEYPHGEVDDEGASATTRPRRSRQQDARRVRVARGGAHGVRPRRAGPAGGDPRAHRRRAGRRPPSAACCCTRSSRKQLPFKIVNRVMGKKQLGDLIDSCYRACGQKETVLLADKLRSLGYTLRDQGRHLDLRRRHADPGAQDRAARDGAEGRAGDRGAVHRRSHHRRRALQQGRRHLGAGLGADRRRDDERDRHRGADQRRDRREAAQPVVQPDLHHGRLGRARLGAADPSAGRHARPHGQAVGRDHRDADHHELPRRVCRCSSTSSRRTAPARVWPTRRSRRRTPGT